MRKSDTKTCNVFNVANFLFLFLVQFKWIMDIIQCGLFHCKRVLIKAFVLHYRRFRETERDVVTHTLPIFSIALAVENITAELGVFHYSLTVSLSS